MDTVGDFSLVAHLSIIKDPRVDRTKKHNLIDILTIAICVVISNAESWDDIEDFGLLREDWSRSFRELPNGIPSHDTFAGVFSRLDTRQLQAAFAAWMQALHRETAPYPSSSTCSPCVEPSSPSTPSAARRASPPKSATRRPTTSWPSKKINRNSLMTLNISSRSPTRTDVIHETHQTGDAGHGRVETRTYQTVANLDTSLPGSAKDFGRAVREHWGIENSVH